MQDIYQGQPVYYSADTIAQSIQTYETHMQAALQICQGLPGVEILRDDLVAKRRVRFLQQQLAVRDFVWQDYEEAVLRGTLLEVVAQEALHTIAQQYTHGSPYEVIFAPPSIFDASTDERKGGDLLLVKKRDDDTYEAISLIDVTVQSKSTKALRSATNDGLGKENVLPVIIVNLADIEWQDIFGKTRETRRFLQSTVRRMFRAGITDFPLCGVDPESLEAILARLRSRVEAGCRRSGEQIMGSRRLPDVRKLVESIAITNKVLGRIF